MTSTAAEGLLARALATRASLGAVDRGRDYNGRATQWTVAALGTAFVCAYIYVEAHEHLYGIVAKMVKIN